MESHYPIWHPFTQMKSAATPLHVVRASGSSLYTDDGKVLIDAISSWWVNLHGHCHPAIAQAIAKQAQTLDHVIFAGFTHDPAIEVSRQLINLLPAGFAKVFFSDDGSTAVEVALKMALQYWHNRGADKTIIIALDNAYHGDTFGAMSVAERNAFNQAFSPLLFDVKRLPLPASDNITALKQLMYEWASGGHVAAFIFEPLVQGAAGMQMYGATFLDELIATAKQLDILCIADEVMTGFGRTGACFAIDHLQQVPDIICLSKGITGGFVPLGATICTQLIYDAFYSDDKFKTFFHGHSYTANPIACAAATASLQLLASDACRNQISAITAAHTAFSNTIVDHGFVKNVRQQGTILAIELDTQERSSYFNGIQQLAYDFYLAHGIYLRPLGNVVYIMPPYCITMEELKRVYDCIALSLDYFSRMAKKEQTAV